MLRTLSRAALFTRLIPLFVLVAACSDTYEEVTSQNPQEDTLSDDTAPAESPYDDALTFTDRRGASVNNSNQRFRFDVAAFQDDRERDDARRLYPSHAAHLAAHPGAIPSVQTIVTYTKQLDDTIYAGVERSAEDGIAPTIASKRTILSGALDWLLAHRSSSADAAAAYVASALRLGGATAAVPADLEATVTRAIGGFQSDQADSKPQGFYTWSDALRAIWAQDRFLQVPLDSGATCALAGAIGAEPSRKEHYGSLVALYSRLTNPLRSSLVDRLDASPTECLAKGPAAFLSRSRTVEIALFEQLYPDGIPAGANLMQDLVDAIRSGKLDLTPKPEDGWYQHQELALETLLVTDKSEERSKIGFTGRYKKRLQEAFETLLVEHRETHVKQADGASGSAGPPPVPEFRLEPMATVYVRHARSYVFLEAALDAAYGKALLDGGTPVAATGTEKESLRDRIHRARDLFYGLYLVASFDIGMTPKLAVSGDPDAASWHGLMNDADHWLQTVASDPMVSADVRVLVPIAALDSGRMRYWAVIGVRTTLASYSFIQGTDMKAPLDAANELRVALPTEQFLEVTSSSVPLSRDEFRALCDTNRTAEQIAAALERR